MANVKQAHIEGKAPFDLHEDEVLQPQLAFLAGPTSGLRLEWTGSAGYIEPNQHGGKTALYSFRLTGQEAVSFKWFDHFVDRIRQLGGEVTTNNVVDIEG